MKTIPLIAFVLFCSFAQAADDDPGWIRLIAHDKTLTLRTDGAERTQAPSNPTSLLFRGQLSPDGASIVYVSDRAIFLADKNGNNARKVSPANVFADIPSWSPD